MPTPMREHVFQAMSAVDLSGLVGAFGGGVFLPPHATTHQVGGSDPLDIDLIPGYVTQEDIDLYVDGTLGDDDSGDGSVLRPYATIAKAHEQVPFILRHSVHIRIAAGSYTGWPSEIYHRAEENGQLTFDGAAPTVTVSVQTITGVATVDPWTIHGIEIIVAAAGWTPNAYRGKYIKIKTGASAGYYLSIVWNDTDTLYCGPYSYPPAIGDDFEIVEPSVIVSATNENYDIRIDNARGPYGSASEYVNAHFGMYGLQFNGTYSAIPLWGTKIRLFSTCALFSLCTFDLTLYAENTSVSAFFLVDEPNGFDDTLAMDVYQSPFVTGIQEQWAVCTNSYLSNMLAFDVVRNYGRPSDLYFCSIGTISAPGGMNAQINYVYNAANNDGVEVFPGPLYVYGLYIEKCNDAFLMENATADLFEVQGNSSSISQYGIKSDALSRIRLTTFTVTGSSGDVRWLFPTGSTVAYPAVNNSITDGHGAYITRKA